VCDGDQGFRGLEQHTAVPEGVYERLKALTTATGGTETHTPWTVRDSGQGGKVGDTRPVGAYEHPGSEI